MSVVGIVAEYNPFHLGHQFHIRRTLEQLGEDSTVVCVMSGDFVQRGEAACYSKFVRAEAACRCGADLVIELPLPWCLASAESFARGAVYLLDALGCDTISFGSEAGQIEPLRDLSDLLVSEAFNSAMVERLSRTPNMSYAAVRQQLAFDFIGERAELLSAPNNILAVEYLKALTYYSSSMSPLTVSRCGSRHDGFGGEYPSAAELRDHLRKGESISDYVPQQAAEVFARADRSGCDRPDERLIETAFLSRLRALPSEAWLREEKYGLGNRLFDAVEEPGLEEICFKAKTKRYALSRIRRAAFRAALGVRDDMTDGAPPYARVLAADSRGLDHLRSRRAFDFPIVTKPASIREIGGRVLEIYELGSRAHDLYALAYAARDARRGGGDWRTSPIIL